MTCQFCSYVPTMEGILGVTASLEEPSKWMCPKCSKWNYYEDDPPWAKWTGRAAAYSAQEKAVIARWILSEVDETVVPGDEGNGEALIYNLYHLCKEGRPFRSYDYAEDQDAEIAAWKLDEREL